MMHRAINADSKTHTLECICGRQFSGKSMDEAWDNYDEHTME